MELSLCNVCGKHYVPELIITTVSPLDELAMVGSSSMIEAYLCRPKKRKDGENNAIQVSDILPFIGITCIVCVFFLQPCQSKNRQRPLQATHVQAQGEGSQRNF